MIQITVYCIHLTDIIINIMFMSKKHVTLYINKNSNSMDNIKFYKTIDECNKELGIETLHPLVSIVDFSKITHCNNFSSSQSSSFYTVFMKDIKCGDLKYGRNYYDYQEGTLVFIAPNQVITVENKQSHQHKGWMLIFHPDLLRGTHLGHFMQDYTFFAYEVSEALHLSKQEREIVMECFHNIELELNHNIDNHSQQLIVSNIELFLNYCTRFYERQFIIRKHVNSDILSRFEKLIYTYFKSDLPLSSGLPTVKYCADKLNLSPNYFGDLLKKETGKSPQEHIQLQLIEVAKEKMYDKNKSVSQIAYELGFEYPQYFSRLFKKCVGVTPNEYKENI